MTHAHIFQPPKSTTQSGRAKSRDWMISLQREQPFSLDPCMKWVGSSETQAQIHLSFPTAESAIAFAQKNGWAYTVHPPSHASVTPKSYSSNFTSSCRR